MQNQIITILSQIQKDLSQVKKRLEELEPVHGSQAWWQKANAKAIESIKSGQGTKVRNNKDLDKFFKSL